MENIKFKNIAELLGKGVEVFESPKALKKQEEKYFLELVETLCQIEESRIKILHQSCNIGRLQDSIS